MKVVWCHEGGSMPWSQHSSPPFRSNRPPALHFQSAEKLFKTQLFVGTGSFQRLLHKDGLVFWYHSGHIVTSQDDKTYTLKSPVTSRIMKQFSGSKNQQQPKKNFKLAILIPAPRNVDNIDHLTAIRKTTSGRMDGPGIKGRKFGERSFNPTI